MANIAVTPKQIKALYTAYDVATQAAATGSVVDATDTFYFVIPDGARAIQRILVEVEVANSHGSVVAQCDAGEMWAAKAKTVTCPQNKTTMFMFEPAKHLIPRAADAIGSNDKEINITLTPASGKRIYTDHAAKVAVTILY